MNIASVSHTVGTVEAIKECLHSTFEQAKEAKKLLNNPADKVKIPENNNPSNTKRELLSNEIYWFFRGVREIRNNYILMFLLLYVTGIRQGELSALKWRNVSKDFSAILIETTYVRYYENGKKIETENAPKSKTSERIMPLPEDIGEMLREQKETAKIIAKQFNREFSEDDYVFTKTRLHEKMDAPYIRGIYKSVQKYLKDQYNIVDIDFSSHYFRHSFASKGMRENIPLETLRQLMGHSNYVVLQKYTHSNEKDKVDAINKLFA